MIADTLFNIPIRQGEPPVVCPHSPFHQLTQTSPLTVYQRLHQWMRDSREFEPHLLSDNELLCLGGKAPSSGPMPVVLRQDGSTLLSLEPATVRLAVRYGWGVQVGEQSEQDCARLLVYASRDRRELVFHQMLVNLAFRVAARRANVA